MKLQLRPAKLGTKLVRILFLVCLTGVGAITSTSRNLKLLATTYWALCTCQISFYVQDDHPSGTWQLIARYGSGYSGPVLPIVDGMPEFARPIPGGMTEQDIIDRFVAPWAAQRPFPTQEGNA